MFSKYQPKPPPRTAFGLVLIRTEQGGDMRCVWVGTLSCFVYRAPFATLLHNIVLSEQPLSALPDFRLL